MEYAFPRTIMDAFIVLAFDIPPIAHPPVGLITDDTIRMHQQAWPTVNIDLTSHPVVGITPSSWLMIDGIGWRRFQGNISAIAAACNVMQLTLLTDRAVYLTAVERYQHQSRNCVIGGLLEINMGDGQCAIRMDDITIPDVKEGFLEAIRGKDIRFVVYPVRPSTFAVVGSDCIDADVWWQFAWGWKTSIQT